MAEHEEHPDPERLWRHRRWMGWCGVAGMMLIPGGALAAAHWMDPHTVEAVRSILISGVWASLGLAAVYAGGASLVDAMARLRHGGSAQR